VRFLVDAQLPPALARRPEGLGHIAEHVVDHGMVSAPHSVAGGIMNRAMSPQISIDRDAVSAFCRRHHITRLALFGSVLRDNFGPESDIDVLVEFQPGHVPGLKFVSIERELSGLLHGRRVDMVTAKFLNPRIRDEVLGSAEPLYVAA
jgi:predicted nucleotidyltransferase